MSLEALDLIGQVHRLVHVLNRKSKEEIAKRRVRPKNISREESSRSASTWGWHIKLPRCSFIFFFVSFSVKDSLFSQVLLSVQFCILTHFEALPLPRRTG